jgi:Rrf2 family protein
MLSMKAKYALKALLRLAREYESAPIQISDLAREETIPRKFLEGILLDLKRSGFLQSRRGRTGGYQLAMSPEEISFGSIIRHIDGPLAPIPCVSVTAYRKCRECADETTCGIRLVMKEVRDSTAAILDRRSLGDVLRGIDGAQGSEDDSPGAPTASWEI